MRSMTLVCSLAVLGLNNVLNFKTECLNGEKRQKNIELLNQV